MVGFIGPAAGQFIGKKSQKIGRFRSLQITGQQGSRQQAKLMAGLPHMVEDDHILVSLTQLLNKDMRDGMRRTVLHLALIGVDKKTKNLAAIIELFLRYKADVNAVDEDRPAPLHYLAYYGNRDHFFTIGELLCDYEADID